MRINTNVAAINGVHNLSRSNAALNSNFERLSTGLRINRAADDGAGLGVSESLRAEVRGLNQAMRNANDGISIVQTAEGSLSEIQSNIQRLRELAVQAASETLEDTERAYIQTEAEALISEIDRAAGSANFNGIELLSGNATTISVQVATGTATATNQINITLNEMSASTLGIDSGSISFATAGGALTAIDALDTALAAVSDQRSDIGATQNSISSAVNAIATAVENLSAAESQIREVDFAMETAEMSRNQVLQQSGISVLSQANQTPQNVLKLLG